MYEKLYITENHVRVLSLFTSGFGERYIREVAKALVLSPRTAQLILMDLEQKGVLESQTKGKIRSYHIRRSGISRRYFTFAEHYKAIVFLDTNLMLKEIVEKISPFIRGIGIIFGSYAKGTATKDSDVDLFIAGDADRAVLKKISTTYGIDLSVKIYPLTILEKNLRTDILLKEIMKCHVAFLNAEQFVQMVLNNG
ncbi:MAG TPA: nucleotidyltransferase domain-containing protein [Candidatus Nanoarchaeia archaeon]|nr:nucleotidyltransferase domain-containing protein [Candidatus Nanoarchaeia archaeon]